MVFEFRYYIITYNDDVQPPGPVPTRSLTEKIWFEYKVEREEKKRERKDVGGILLIIRKYT